MTKPAQFPTWTPPKLREWHEFLSLANYPFGTFGARSQKWQITWANYLPQHEMAELVYAWSTRPSMKEVWKSVGKYAGEDLNDAAYFLCHNAISRIALFRSAKPMTNAEKQKHYSAVATAARDLSQLMGDCVEFRDCRLDEFINDTQASNLAHSVANVSFGEATAKAPRTDLDLLGTKTAIEWCLPDFRSLLAALGDRATIEAARPAMTAHKAGKAAEINYVSRAMSRLFSNYLGKPLDATVATFLESIYPMAISVDQVRKARKRDSEMAAAYTKKPDKNKE